MGRAATKIDIAEKIIFYCLSIIHGQVFSFICTYKISIKIINILKVDADFDNFSRDLIIVP